MTACGCILAALPASAQQAPALDEIVVTATRRAEVANKVPVSISAFSREQLDQQGVRSFADVIAMTPGISMVAGNSFAPPNIAIRGVQSLVGAQTTGVYIDDTPVQSRSRPATSGSALPAIFDLERVEILRGPQGTMFGAGSEGGTIRFLTPPGSLHDTKAYVRAELATGRAGDPSYELGAAIGTPVVADKVGIRVSAWQRRDGGYIDRVDPVSGVLRDENANRTDSRVLRATVTAAAADWLTVTPSLYYQRVHRDDAAQYYPRLSRPDDNPVRSGRLLAQPGTDRFYLPALKAEAALGFATLTSVTSFFDRRENFTADYSNLDIGLGQLFTGQPQSFAIPPGYQGAPADGRNRQKSLTQEVRLQSSEPGSRLSWLVGMFWQRQRQSDDFRVADVTLAPLFQAVFGSPNVDGVYNYTDRLHATDRQFAGFASVGYRVLERLTLTAGLRAARTKFDFTDISDGPLNHGPNSNRGSQKEYPVTPKFDLSWQADDDNLFYATVAKGYRIGGANAPVPVTPLCVANLREIGLTAAPDSYRSDSTWSYEAGAKNRIAGGRVQLNSSAYHVDWNDIQQQVSLSQCAGTFVSNLGKARSNGFDLSAQARVTSQLLLTVAAGYNKTTYAHTIQSGGAILVERGAIVSDVPPWKLALTLEYAFEIAGRDAYLRATDEFQSRNNGRWTKVSNPLASGYDPTLQRNPSTNLVKLRAGIAWDGFDTSIFIDNLFDRRPQLNHVRDSLPGAQNFYATTFRPRTVGLTGTYRY